MDAISFKSPSQKKITEGVGQAVSLAMGGAVSRGASNAVNSLVAKQGVSNPLVGKAITLGVGVLLAAGWNGAQKKNVQAAGIGMAAIQALEIGTDFARKNIQRKADAGPLAQFGYDVLGLAGGCGCGSDQEWQHLGAPVNAERINWNNWADLEEAQTVEIGNQTFGM